jgi:hypothetical protein
VVHERSRCLVGGVQVIDHEHHTALRGSLHQQLGDRGEHAVAIHGLFPLPRGAAGRGQQSRKRDLCAVAQRAGQFRTPRRERVKCLYERRVGCAAFLLVGGATQRVKPQLPRTGQHGLGQARLADPERARDEQRTAVSGRGVLQRAERRAELSLTPFDGSEEEPRRVDRGTAHELALKCQRLPGGLRTGRGRDARCQAPPAQIPASASR